MDKEEIVRKTKDAQESTETVAQNMNAIAADISKESLPEAENMQSKIANGETMNIERAKQNGNDISDPEDIYFIIRGWLYFIWWIGNAATAFYCLWSFAKSVDSYYTRDTAWIYLLIELPGLLLLNRLIYELAIAIFECVRHLRQIRDELRKLNRSQTPGTLT